MSGRNWLARLAAALGGLMLVVLAATPAQARWLKAESARFIVYSDGDQKTLEGYSRKLETLDTLLRLLHGLPKDGTPPRKLPIYLVANDNDLRVVWPTAPRAAAGFYITGDEDIFAVAIRAGREDDIVFHEYAHHFMMQYFPFGYPDWMVEGWADYYGAVTMDTRYVTYGKYNQLRARQLLESTWIPLADIVTKRSRSFTDPEKASLFYGEAWILTHWFQADKDRRKALDVALRAIASGAEPAREIEKAAGMPMADLQRYLKDKYLPGEMPYQRIPAESFYPLADVRITELSPAAGDLLLLSQRLKGQITDEEKPALVALVRRVAGKYPADPMARIALARSELQFGDHAEGVRQLEALLKDNPDNVQALQFLAADHLRIAGENDGQRTVQLREASALLGRAYKADPENYTTAYLAARVRMESGAASYPSENDVELWALAYAIAPQYADIRLGLGDALIRRSKFAQAITLLEPLANDPHGRGGSAAARQMIERAKAQMAAGAAH